MSGITWDMGQRMPHTLAPLLVAVLLHVAAGAGIWAGLSTPIQRQAIVTPQVWIDLTPPKPQSRIEQSQPSRPSAQGVAKTTPPSPLTAAPEVLEPTPLSAAPAASSLPAPHVATAPTPAVSPQPAAPTLTAARFDAAYLNNPKPTYPMMARRLGEEGRVLLRVHVNAEGRAEKIEFHTGSGSDRLDQAARDTVALWRFLPARRGDEPIASWVTVPITFKLEQ